jgi:cystathionine beta-lyase/cystathionine gamma-synthase
MLGPLRARFPGMLVVADNTWLTHVLHSGDELRAYADLAVLSLTKHYSAGLVIVGAVVDLVSHRSSPSHTVTRSTGSALRAHTLHPLRLLSSRRSCHR